MNRQTIKDAIQAYSQLRREIMDKMTKTKSTKQWLKLQAQEEKLDQHITMLLETLEGFAQVSQTRQEVDD